MKLTGLEVMTAACPRWLMDDKCSVSTSQLYVFVNTAQAKQKIWASALINFVSDTLNQ